MSKKRIRALLIAYTVHRNGYSGQAWELPATAEAYERMLEQGCDALRHRPFGTTYEQDVKAIAAAWGITSPKKGRT